MTPQLEAAVCTEKLQAILHILRRRALVGMELYKGQPPILEYVSQNPGCTQVEIAQELFITPSAVAQSTKRMQRDALLEKHMDEGNQRCKRLYITEKGTKQMEDARHCLHGVYEMLFAALNEDELAQFNVLFRKLLQHAAEQADIDIAEMDFFAFMRFKHSLHHTEKGHSCHGS